MARDRDWHGPPLMGRTGLQRPGTFSLACQRSSVFFFAETLSLAFSFDRRHLRLLLLPCARLPRSCLDRLHPIRSGRHHGFVPHGRLSRPFTFVSPNLLRFYQLLDPTPCRPYHGMDSLWRLRLFSPSSHPSPSGSLSPAWAPSDDMAVTCSAQWPGIPQAEPAIVSASPSLF